MTKANLGAEAVAYGRNLLEAHFPQGLDTRYDDWIDVLGRMRVLAVGPMLHPSHDVEIGRPVHIQGVAVEEIDHECCVACRREAVGHELAVLPDADDIGHEEHAAVAARRGFGCFGQVGVDLAVDLGHLARRLAPCSTVVSTSSVKHMARPGLGKYRAPISTTRHQHLAKAARGSTDGGAAAYSKRVPTVQHLPGGLEAISLLSASFNDAGLWSAGKKLSEKALNL